MAGEFPQKWYLELDGKRMGPFSPEQVLGLLSDGEIPEGLRVMPSDELGAADLSRVMTAAEMREAYFHDERIPTAKAAPDVLPSIPVAQDETGFEAEKALATSRRLFDLFQSAKERRARFLPPPTEEQSKDSSVALGAAKWIRNPAVAASLVASVLAVGGVRYFRKSGTLSEDSERKVAQSKENFGSERAPLEKEPPKEMMREVPKKEEKLVNTWKPAPRQVPPPKKAEAFQRPGNMARSSPTRPTTPLPPNRENWADQAPPRGNDWNNNSGNTQPYQPPEGQVPPPPGWDPNSGYNAGGPPPGGAPGGYNSGAGNDGQNYNPGAGYNGYPEGGPPGAPGAPPYPGQPQDQMPRDPNQDPYAQPQQNY